MLFKFSSCCLLNLCSRWKGVWDASSVAALRMFSSTLSISSPPRPITWLILCFAIVPHCWVLSWRFWWDQAQLCLAGLLRLYQRRQNHTSSKNCLIGFCLSIFFWLIGLLLFRRRCFMGDVNIFTLFNCKKSDSFVFSYHDTPQYVPV